MFHCQEILCGVCRQNSKLKDKNNQKQVRSQTNQFNTKQHGDFLLGIEYVTVPCKRSASTQWTVLSALFLPMSYDAMKDVFYNKALCCLQVIRLQLLAWDSITMLAACKHHGWWTYCSVLMDPQNQTMNHHEHWAVILVHARRLSGQPGHIPHRHPPTADSPGPPGESQKIHLGCLCMETAGSWSLLWFRKGLWDNLAIWYHTRPAQDWVQRQIACFCVRIAEFEAESGPHSDEFYPEEGVPTGGVLADMFSMED